jgi:hypothetical protein
LAGLVQQGHKKSDEYVIRDRYERLLRPQHR